MLYAHQTAPRKPIVSLRTLYNHVSHGIIEIFSISFGKKRHSPYYKSFRRKFKFHNAFMIYLFQKISFPPVIGS